MVFTNLSRFMSALGAAQTNGVYHRNHRRTMIHSDYARSSRLVSRCLLASATSMRTFQLMPAVANFHLSSTTGLAFQS